MLRSGDSKVDKTYIEAIIAYKTDDTVPTILTGKPVLPCLYIYMYAVMSAWRIISIKAVYLIVSPICHVVNSNESDAHERQGYIRTPFFSNLQPISIRKHANADVTARRAAVPPPVNENHVPIRRKKPAIRTAVEANPVPSI